jgi:prolipoprotein diacylglyceryltransferase
VLWLDRKKVIPRGRLLAVYVVGYGVGRLWIELLRIDPAGHLFGVRVNVWVSLLAIVGGTAALVWPARRDAPVEPEEDDDLDDERESESELDDELDAEPEAEINE